MYLRKTNTLARFFDDQPHYKVRLTLIITNTIVLLFNIIAFATFSGIMNSKFNVNTDGLLIGIVGNERRSWNYSGGFGLSIVVSILSTYTSITEYLWNDDTSTMVTVKNPMVTTAPV